MTEQTPEQKRELLAKLLRERAAQVTAARAAPSDRDNPAADSTSSIRTIPRGGDLPLSFGQERVWFHEEMQPEILSYNVLVRVGLSGRLDVNVLRRSLEVVVARHEVLRETFPAVDGVPVVRILAPTTWQLPVVDLREVPESDRDSEARRFTTTAAKIRFDLTTGPLLRSLVLRLADDEYILVLVFHHIAIDGWSIDVFLQEMTSVYDGFISGTTPNLPDLPLQYADFAQWQREWLTGDVFETHRAYWAKKLASPLPVLELPADRRPSTTMTYEGSTRLASLDGALLDGLRELSRREGVTFYTTLLAALNTLLHRYAAQDDIVVGTFVAGRVRSEVDSVMGFFVNTLALRTDLSGDPTFRETLQRTRDVVLEANTHAGFPYEKLLEELRPQRSLNRSPLFQIIFNFLGFRYGAELSLAGLRVQSLPALEFHSTTENLTIFAFDRKSTIELTLVYNPQLFDAETVDLFLGHFKVLLAGIVAQPEARLSTLPLLSPTERRRLLVEINSGDTDFPADQCYTTYFEDQVRRTPDAIAVKDDGGTLTYSELNARANRIARTLVSAGVRVNQPVALLAERGRTLLTWILATLKAGGVYLPIDPRYPSGRHASILRQSGAGIVLVTDELAARLDDAIADLPAASLPRVFKAGELAKDEDDATDLPPRARPEDVAYIIFTSGSTGSPKGAMVPHRAMLNHFWSKIHAFEISSADVIVQSAPQGFDISVWQFLAGLLAGARIRIAPDSVSTEPERLFALIEREAITLAQVVPSFLRAFLDELPRAARATEFGHLRWLVLAGEALPPDLCRQWLARWPRTPMVNAYGPSECADITTRHFITEPPREHELHVPIGRPIHNARVYIVDNHDGLAPQGVAGELYIGGAGVGAGYVNDPERTAVSFVPDRFSGVSGARMYRTGDRARIRHDGTVEYLGRTDHQVKIRGLRIELGEIEVAIAQHPKVKEAVVNVWPGPQGPRLVAHLVLSTQTDANIGDALRSHLRETLPRYMVPDAFVVMASLPLSANGKINRGALPVPEAHVAEASVAPRTPTEEVIARVWADVLGLDRVGVKENFFELGGHSLIATRVVARLRKAFRIDLSVRRMFEAQTVAELAASIEADIAPGSNVVQRPNDGENDFQGLLEARADQRFEPFPLTDVQEAYWIGRGRVFEMGNVATHAYSEIDVDGLDIDRFERAWRRLIDRHDMLRAIVRPDGQQQVLEHTPLYVIKRQDLTGLSPNAVEAALSITRSELSHQVLPSDQWPLFEIRASKLDTSRYRIHLSFDMLIGDAWSFAVIQRDFDRFYADPDAQLEPIDISFRDYVLAMVRFRDTADYQRSLAYWDARSPSLPARPDLPLAKDPAAIAHPRFVRRHASLGRDEWGTLQRKATALGLTHNGLILAAYVDVLATWSKRSRFLLNLTLFNRVPVHPQVDDIVGDFTSITLLDAELLPDESFVDLAKRLLGRLWEDLDHRFVTGVHVLRQLARVQPDRISGAAPVVLTSTIGFEGPSTARSDLARRSELKFAISQTSQVWLDQMVSVVDGRLIINWDAVDELFPAGMIDDMFASYVQHLKRLARDDAAWLEPRVERVRRLVPEAQQRQRAIINATAQPVRDTLLHVLFEEQAATRPDQIAIVCEAARLTYAEVARLSRKLGAALRKMGARPNTLVAIVMEKGWEQVVAALAILQSGAAYVPIDANFPDERRLKLIENAGAAFVLTQPGLAATLTWPAGVKVLRVERAMPDGDEIAALAPVQRPEDLAYVIYTSGSTGLPKGVMIDHRGAVNTILDMNQRFAVRPADRVLALSSLSFDLSVYDIFGMLAAGGTIVIPEATATRDPARWAELVEHEGVTIWNSVPALMEMFVEYRTGRSDALPPSLRLILLSGDWIPVTLPAQIRALSRTVQLMSLGGATEASIWSIVYPIEGVERDWKSIPYGRPMVNQTFHVLDETLEPCPIWVPGQLYIGGIGLAKGYWHDAEKTGAKFIVHPRSGERLYSTGDLGRYLPSGDIEFLGREDFQVKIRGFRIELGEIEAAFRQHPSVRSVVVTAVGKATAERRLLAYVVPQPEGVSGAGDGAAATNAGPLGLENDLLEFIASKLPEHMCPARIVVIDHLPLTPNGKVDLRALPVPDAPVAVSGAVHTAPRDDAEAALVRVWQEVLRSESIGIYDNFFELGGDSVSAIQVVSRVVREGYDLSPVMMFRYPTVAELAIKLAPAVPARDDVDEITI